MQLTVYMYPKCGTCRKAIRFLELKEHQLNKINIVENPPNERELEDLIAKSGADPKQFFNTSGQVYKEKNLKDVVPDLTDKEKIELLSSNGKLIKRPIVTDGQKATVGFKQEIFEKQWS